MAAPSNDWASAGGDLNDGQRAALRNLLGTVLSPYGLNMVQEQMAADDVLKAETLARRHPADPA